MLNLQIGIIKELHNQGFLSKSQMETAIDIITKECRKASKNSALPHEVGNIGKAPVMLTHTNGTVTA